MDRSLIVRIFVPTKKNGQDGGGNYGRTGTGYAVGGNLILTSLHVARPDDRDPNYPIEVLWDAYQNCGPNDGWIPLKTGPIAWEGKNGLDAALLQCPYPPDVRSFGFVSREMPRDNTEWTSAGFPKITRKIKGYESTPFRGKMFTIAPHQPWFNVDVLGAVPEREEDWQGASGMPICKADTNLILGVVSQIPSGLGAKRIFVAPTFRMLEDPGFRKVIGTDDQQKRLQNARSSLEKLCRGSPKALESIIQKSGLFGEAKATPTPEQVVKQLLECTLPEVIDGLVKANNWIQDELQTDASDKLAKAAKTLQGIVQWLAPALFDEGVVNGVRAHKLDPNLTICEIPCVLPTVAEIVMAGVDSRRAEYHPRKKDIEYPHGTRHLPPPPEPGIADHEQHRQAVRDMAVKKFLPGSWSMFRRAINDYLFRRLDQPLLTGREPEQIRLAAIELQNLSRKRECSYYLLYKLPQDVAAKREMEEGLRELRQDFPALVLLGLADDQKIREREVAEFGLFCDLIPISHDDDKKIRKR